MNVSETFNRYFNFFLQWHDTTKHNLIFFLQINTKIIKVNPADNVIVALTDLVQNEQIAFEGTTVSPITDVKAKHKIVNTQKKGK